MKKLLSLCLAVALALSLCACGVNAPAPAPGDEPKGTQEAPEKEEAQTSEAGTANIANPIVTYTSLDELNEVCGLKLSRPAVMGVSDEVFQTLPYEGSVIAEYRFTVNGTPYILRGSAVVTGDISGVYTGGATAFSGYPDFEEAVAETDELKLARWYTVDGQYVLMIEDKGSMDSKTFEAIAKEMHTLTAMDHTHDDFSAYYESLAGFYQDRVSQRASLTAEALEGGLHISVRWGNSAFETCLWEMTVFCGEDGLLNYTDGVTSVSNTAEDGTTTITENSCGDCGFFTETDGVLFWNGAPDENCLSCEFEKLPE